MDSVYNTNNGYTKSTRYNVIARNILTGCTYVKVEDISLAGKLAIEDRYKFRPWVVVENSICHKAFCAERFAKLIRFGYRGD